MKRPPVRNEESGLALLIVLVVLFIVAVLMVDIALTANTARRSAKNATNSFVMDAAIDGQFRVSVTQLLYDAQDNQYDSPDDRWHKEMEQHFGYVYPHPNVSREANEEEDDERILDEEEEEPVAGVETVADTEDVRIDERLSRIEDESRKFNLLQLLDANLRKDALNRLAILIDRYREDSPLDISSTKAQQLAEAIDYYVTQRPDAAEGESGKVPVPEYEAGRHPWRILTPDELVNARDFEDSSREWSAKFLLYDQQDPDEVAAYIDDPELDEPPAYAGLLRYLTVWSGASWKPDWRESPEPELWALVNVNTASLCMLESMFVQPQDYTYAERLYDALRQNRDDGDAEIDEEIEASEDLPTRAFAETPADLQNAERIDDEELRTVLAATGPNERFRNALVTTSSNTFSIYLVAEMNEQYKQVRYVVRRGADGTFTTLFREERHDPLDFARVIEWGDERDE